MVQDWYEAGLKIIKPPAQGIRDILDIVDSPRRAWFWMVQPSPLLGNKRPIDLLKQDRRRKVVEAARTVFDRP